jgi:hypothetical protein
MGTYFLDFDRTLFDTDSFTPTLVAHPACAEIKDDIQRLVDTPRDSSLKGGAGRYEVWEKLDTLCQAGILKFAPGELKRFVFPDVPDFLARHGSESVIVSFGHPDWIRSKIESSLGDMPIEKVIYVHDREKGLALAAILKDFGGPYAIVDDLAAQLDSVALYCPDVIRYEIRRDGKESSGRHQTIHSLSEIT